ncbi:MAG: HNH endonuclease [Desulfobacula sp.]|jgi:5-methylcytosine-specific restriction endonuclease McrA|uniref:HNH endonuclease n=1 Tax=Desulfobacula sp. TaxID=2593537 RepID=UPI0039B8CF4D|nr:HNH endonuclease [Desulfobacula sp.]
MIPKKIVNQVFERDNYSCQLCPRQYHFDDHSLHCHHIKLKSQGGKDTVKNLLSVCWECHNKIHEHKI